MKKNVFVLAGLMAFAGLSAAAAPNLVVNGSFESTVQKNHTWGTYTSLPGWTGLPTIEVRNNVAGRAQDGKNFVELDTNRNSGMSQSIFASGLVELSFWYSARPKTGATNDIQVKFGDSFEAVVLHGVSNATSSNIWQKFTQVINLGNSPSSVLSFYARGKSDSYGGSLDNISVTAVPEPETFAMLLAGLGLMGAVARRRKGVQAGLAG
jgi:hypothetical protein